MSTEAQVLSLLQGQNKPFGLQNLVDLLAHAGSKKAAIQKALDALSESGKIICKEFGKTKIYLPTQSDLSVLSKEELDAKRAQIKELGEQLQQERSGLKEVEQELSSWQSSLTEEQLKEQVQLCTQQLADKQTKLAQLRGGAVLVSKEQCEAAVKALASGVEAWKKRKAMFRNIWSTISEGMDGPQQEYFEEMGIETDEATGADLKKAELLLPGASGGANKRPRTVLGRVN